jgi:hypothetical protein
MRVVAVRWQLGYEKNTLDVGSNSMLPPIAASPTSVRGIYLLAKKQKENKSKNTPST